MRMTFFALLALLGGCVSQADLDKCQAENKALKDRIEKMDARAEAQLKAFKDLLNDFKPLIDKGLVKVEVVDGRITLAVASDVLFASGSAELSPAGRENVADIARILSKRVGDRDFQVEGHTDNEPINTPQFPNNWYLGAARAIAVTQVMINNGFPEDHISASSFGDNAPVAPNASAGGKAQNRRIEIVLLPDLSELPGYKKIMAESGARPRPRKNK